MTSSTQLGEDTDHTHGAAACLTYTHTDYLGAVRRRLSPARSLFSEQHPNTLRSALVSKETGWSCDRERRSGAGTGADGMMEGGERMTAGAARTSPSSRAYVREKGGDL